MLNLKIKYVWAFCLIICVLTAKGQSRAEEIYDKAMTQLMSKDLEMSVAIKEINKSGKTKEKTFDVLIARFGQVKKILNILRKPERAKGVTIVLTDYPYQVDIIEIYTPANGKIRKLKATSKNLAMIGTGLSIADFTTKNQNTRFSLLGKEAYNGRSHFKIRMEDPTDPEVDSIELLIEEGTYCIAQIKYYDQNGNAKSINEFSEFQSLTDPKGKIQPMQISYRDLENNKSSEIKILMIKSRPDLREEDFDIQLLVN